MHSVPDAVEGSDAQSQQWESLGQILCFLNEFGQARVLDDLVPSKTDGTVERPKLDYQIAMDCARAGLTRGDYVALYAYAAHEGYSFPGKALECERRQEGAGLKYLHRTYDRAYAEVIRTQGAASIALAVETSEAETAARDRRIRFQTVSELARRPRREALIEGALFERTLESTPPWPPARNDRTRFSRS